MAVQLTPPLNRMKNVMFCKIISPVVVVDVVLTKFLCGRKKTFYGRGKGTGRILWLWVALTITTRRRDRREKDGSNKMEQFARCQQKKTTCVSIMVDRRKDRERERERKKGKPCFN